VYTPKGDLKILPKGATALDFAFNIHSEIGYHCQAVKINNKLVPMGYKLQSGDQVSVITNKSQKPGESWLKWVVTGKARERIRQALREEERKFAEFGKEALQRKFEHLKVEFEPSLDVVMKYFGYRSRHDIYLAVSNESLDLIDDFKAFRVEKGKLIPVEDDKTPLSNERKTVVKTDKKPKLFINGEPASGYNYELADCCKPVQGDDVFAFITSNNILKIHRTVCNNAANLAANYGYRIMKAEWGTDAGSSFIAELLITGIDTGPGVIERLSGHISNQLGLNIRSFSIEGDEGYFEGRIKLIVRHKDQLQIAIKALKSLEGVSNVIRID
jgi:GTP pyrophosphokinase